MMKSDSITLFLIFFMCLGGLAQDENFELTHTVSYNFTAECSPEDVFPQNTTRNGTRNETFIAEKCQAFYRAYVYYAGEFTSCELQHSIPFRICNECVVPHKLSTNTYNNFIHDEDLNDCRIKFMKQDRVQILTSMEIYIEDIWKNAACHGCTQDVRVDSCSGHVNYTIPDDVVQFMSRYRNLSQCLNFSLEEADLKLWNYEESEKKSNQSLCMRCLTEYNDLNSHYEHMSSNTDGNVCMDIVDRMNHTRLVWSHTFGCSPRSSHVAPVIAITCVIGPLPLFFYGILRYLGKEKKSRVVKQKRLASARRSTRSTNVPYTELPGPSNSFSTSVPSS